jgi:hypothetical protein
MNLYSVLDVTTSKLFDLKGKYGEKFVDSCGCVSWHTATSGSPAIVRVYTPFPRPTGVSKDR